MSLMDKEKKIKANILCYMCKIEENISEKQIKDSIKKCIEIICPDYDYRPYRSKSKKNKIKK